MVDIKKDISSHVVSKHVANVVQHPRVITVCNRTINHVMPHPGAGNDL